MYPNPQDALPLPPRPNLEQYKKQAKDLLKASRDPQSLRAWITAWVQSLARLTDLEITPGLPVQMDRWIDGLEQFAQKKLAETNSLTTAQFILARAHGFLSWPKLTKHIEAIARENSSTNHFEQAAEAVIAGEAPTLQHLLSENPKLIHARSTREHQATLLHYVAANGVEGYRQKTPANAEQIAQILLAAGAAVNATANVYGSQLTTLHLMATSVHPERAGLQQTLMQLLLDHDAALDPAIVNACLSNGRGPAAEFLADHGAHLDLQSAAGVGRLDLVQTFFSEQKTDTSNAINLHTECALLFASQYGRNPIIEFLLDQGVPITAQANTGQTALHWAVIGGHLATVNLLLTRGADLEAKNTYGGSALGQALWSAAHGDSPADYVPIIAALLNANAQIEDGTLAWLGSQKRIAPATKQRLADLLKLHGAKS